MYPHGRLLLASLTFSGVLGVLVALAGVVVGFLIWGEPPAFPLDDAPIRAVVSIIVLVAPTVAALPLFLSIPASYFQWGRPLFSFSRVSLACGLIAAVVFGVLLFPGPLGSTFVFAAVFTLLMIISAWCWRLAMPRSNTSLERTLER